MSDPINHPSHYQGPVEVIDIIEGFGLNFHLGNVVKYLLRAGRKGDALEDLKKARWYLEREIDRRVGQSDTKAGREKGPDTTEEIERRGELTTLAMRAAAVLDGKPLRCAFTDRTDDGADRVVTWRCTEADGHTKSKYGHRMEIVHDTGEKKL